MPGLSTEKAAPAGIVLAHYGFGALAFLVLTVAIFFSPDSFSGHYFNPRLLAITHIATLGWGSMVIFGALYQFLPVVLVSDLFSALLARITFFFFAAGIILLVYSFWNFNVGLSIQLAAVSLFIAASLFVYNMIATSAGSKKENIEGDFIVSSCIWFWLTVLLGALLAFNFTYAFLSKEHLYYLKIHAHIGIAGWFLMLVMGVSSRLIPMFLLSAEVSKKRLKYAYYIVNISLLAFFVDGFFYGGVERSLLYFFLILVGFAFYFSFIFLVYRRRARKVLDIGMKQSLVAFVVIAIPVITGFLVNSGLVSNEHHLLQLTIVYGASIFLGFVSLLIMGQTFKTLPFIVWLKLNREPHADKALPLPKDLYSERMVILQFLFYAIGFSGLIAGILLTAGWLIQAAAACLVITAVIYNINVFGLIFFKHGQPGRNL